MPQKEKISVSIDRDAILKVRKTAGPRMVSDFVNEAVLLRLQAMSLAKIIDAHGVVLTPELLAEIDREWPAN